MCCSVLRHVLHCVLQWVLQWMMHCVMQCVPWLIIEQMELPAKASRIFLHRVIKTSSNKCATWPIQTCDMTHSYVCQDPIMRGTFMLWIIHKILLMKCIIAQDYFDGIVYVCVCACVCVYVCTHVSMCVWECVWECVCAHTRARACVYMCMCVCV